MHQWAELPLTRFCHPGYNGRCAHFDSTGKPCSSDAYLVPRNETQTFVWCFSVDISRVERSENGGEQNDEKSYSQFCHASSSGGGLIRRKARHTSTKRNGGWWDENTRYCKASRCIGCDELAVATAHFIFRYSFFRFSAFHILSFSWI